MTAWEAPHLFLKIQASRAHPTALHGFTPRAQGFHASHQLPRQS